MAPVAVAAGETTEYRIDYEVLGSEFQRLEANPTFDWSPLQVHSYRYLTNGEGKPSFRVVLKVPESLVDTNGTDRWFFYSPQIRIVDTSGNTQIQSTPPGVLSVLVRHAKGVESGGWIYDTQTPGSWWIVAPDVRISGSFDWETSLRDRSRVLLPPGVELFIAGLDTRIVQYMLSLYGIAPSSTFRVFTEGPFELFPWDDRDRTLPKFRTRLIPRVRPGWFDILGPTWALGVRARADAQPGDTGRLVAVFLLENGDEWGRRELRLEVTADPLASLGDSRLVNHDGDALHTAHLLGAKSQRPGNYKAILYASKQLTVESTTNAIISYDLYRLTTSTSWVEWIPSQYLPGGCPECRVVSGSLTCESPNQFYYKLTYAPGTVIATTGYNPFGSYGELVGSLQLPWSLATYREVRGSALGPLEIRARFRPPSSVEYKTVRAPTFDSISILSGSKVEPCPPNSRSYAWRDFWRKTNSISLSASADFGIQRIQIRLEEGGGSYIDPAFLITADLPFPWTAPADTPETQVQLLANPSALRLDQLTSTNRP